MTGRQCSRRITAKEGTPLDPNSKPPVEPEVEDRIPLEPEQLQRALENQIVGQLVARVVCFRSTKDQRERYAVVLENGACLLFAPDGQNLVMTLIQNVQNVQEER